MEDGQVDTRTSPMRLRFGSPMEKCVSVVMVHDNNVGQQAQKSRRNTMILFGVIGIAYLILSFASSLEMQSGYGNNGARIAGRAALETSGEAGAKTFQLERKNHLKQLLKGFGTNMLQQQDELVEEEIAEGISHHELSESEYSNAREAAIVESHMTVLGGKENAFFNSKEISGSNVLFFGSRHAGTTTSSRQLLDIERDRFMYLFEPERFNRVNNSVKSANTEENFATNMKLLNCTLNKESNWNLLSALYRPHKEKAIKSWMYTPVLKYHGQASWKPCWARNLTMEHCPSYLKNICRKRRVAIKSITMDGKLDDILQETRYSNRPLIVMHIVRDPRSFVASQILDPCKRKVKARKNSGDKNYDMAKCTSEIDPAWAVSHASEACAKVEDDLNTADARLLDGLDRSHANVKASVWYVRFLFDWYRVYERETLDALRMLVLGLPPLGKLDSVSFKAGYRIPRWNLNPKELSNLRESLHSLDLNELHRSECKHKGSRCETILSNQPELYDIITKHCKGLVDRMVKDSEYLKARNSWFISKFFPRAVNS